MRKSLIFLLICLWACGFPSQAQSPTSDEVTMKPDWLIKTGDNADYAKPDFKTDTSWKSIDPSYQWEQQGFKNYDGVAWYRRKVVIPSSLKKKEAVLQALKLYLGKINHNDITYFNGKVVGQSQGASTIRDYFIPYDAIKWDKENVIAVRIENPKDKGGMFAKPPKIAAIGLNDLIEGTYKESVRLAQAPQPLSFQEKVLLDYKAGFQAVNGKLTIEVKNILTNQSLYKDTRQVSISPKGISQPDYSFTAQEAGSYKAYFSFTDDIIKDTVKHEVLLAVIQTPRPAPALTTPLIKPSIAGKAAAFPLEQIHLSGYLQDKLDINHRKRLLNVDEKGITECFYNRPGKQEWVGEYTGKYLHAATRVWRNTHDPALKQQMDRIVDVFIGSQDQNGYFGAYLPKNYWSSWDVWSHKYDMLGLLSYYGATAYKPALDASIKIGDLLCRTFGNGPGQRTIIEGPNVGMANTSVLEPMTELYRYTGNKKYLDFCNYIVDAYEVKHGPKIISTLLTVGQVNKVANGKAYEMMSNFTGLVKLYQITGEEKLLKAMQIAWDDVATRRLYITGSASKGELFKEEGYLPAENDDHIAEGCVSTTWLQFSQAMYYVTGEQKYIDEIEKTVYNHLTAAEDPVKGCVSYYTALQGKKPYRCNIDSHCCLASVPRGIAAVPELAFCEFTDNGLAINFYTAGTLQANVQTQTGQSLPIQLTVQTNFPSDGKVKLALTAPQKATYKIALRVPAWCKSFRAKANGKTYSGQPGQYLVLEQNWDKNTVIDLTFDLPTQELDGGQSYTGHIAVKRGPQVLVIDDALNPEIKDWSLVKLSASNSPTLPPAPQALPSGWQGQSAYQLMGKYGDKPQRYTLVPFADAGQSGGELRTWIKKE